MYQPKDSSQSPRFCGVRTFMRLECLPSHDHGEITGGLAAAVAYEMVTLVALKKRAKQAKQPLGSGGAGYENA